MLRALFAVSLLVPLAFVPTAAASACAAEAPHAPLYVWRRFGAPSQVVVYQESNGVDGLQRGPCKLGNVWQQPDEWVAGTQEIWPPCWNGGTVCLF